VAKDEEIHNYNDQLGSVNPLSFKRIGFSLAPRPFWDLSSSSSVLGKASCCLLPRVLSGPQLLPSRLLYALSGLGPGSLGKSVDSFWLAKDLDSRLLGISTINEGIEVDPSIPFIFLSLYSSVCSRASLLLPRMLG
jgi:hypothetical protein